MLAVYLCPTQHCPQLLRLGAGAISRLARGGEAVRVFRPIVAEAAGDAVLDALAEVAGHDPTAAWGATAEELVVNPTAAVGQVISRYRACADEVGRVLVLGSEYDCSLAPVEFSWNARIAANLGVPMVLVVPSDGGAGPTRARIEVALDQAARDLAQVLAVLVPAPLGGVDVGPLPLPVYAVSDSLPARALGEALAALDAAQVAGPRPGAGQAGSVVVADMGLANLLPEVRDDSVVVFSADRAEIGVGLAVAGASGAFSYPRRRPRGRAVAARRRRGRGVGRSAAPRVPLLRTDRPDRTWPGWRSSPTPRRVGSTPRRSPRRAASWTPPSTSISTR